MLLLLIIFAVLTGEIAADVYYVEEVVNPGFGTKKTGARKTTNKVYIKGSRQKIHSTIQTDKKLAKALQRQGQPLLSSKILRLDKADVFEVDLDKYTYRQEKLLPLPAAKVAASSTQKMAGRSKPKFAVKETGDTTRIAGFLCHKVVVQMRVGYRDPKTKKNLKENRYTYAAWIARDFPGYREIQTFQQRQAQQTIYPSLAGGGIDQLREVVDDYEQLADTLKVLEGFAMRSTIRASVLRPSKKEVQVFRLDREIKSLLHQPLPDSVFEVSQSLTRIKK